MARFSLGGGKKASPEVRRERIEKRIDLFEKRRPPKQKRDEHNGDLRPLSKAEKDRVEYVNDKQLQRAKRELENHDQRLTPPSAVEVSGVISKEERQALRRRQ